VTCIAYFFKKKSAFCAADVLFRLLYMVLNQPPPLSSLHLEFVFISQCCCCLLAFELNLFAPRLPQELGA